MRRAGTSPIVPYLFALVVPATLAGALAIDVVAHAFAEPADQYPDDAFAFACDVPAVDIGDGATALECSLVLTRCIDAMTEQCGASGAKACRELHWACIGYVEDVCWPAVAE